MFSFETLLFIILLILILLSLRKTDDPALSIEKCDHLRGIFALTIYIFHISKSGDILEPLLTFLSLTTVAAFFFISGYGIMKGYLKKPEYYKHFLKKRFYKLILPYLIMTFVYWLYFLLIGEPVSIAHTIIGIITDTPIVSYSWFIPIIIACYLGFYLLMLIFKDNKKGLLAATAFISLLALFLLIIDHPLPFCDSFYFGSGILFAASENKISAVLRSNKVAVLLISAAILLATQIFPIIVLPDETKIVTGNIVFIILMLLLIQFYEFKNKIIRFFGEISLELYMCQGLAKMMVRRFFSSVLFIEDIVIFLITVMMSIFFHKVFDLIAKKAS